jgi:hypothetical protein
MVADQTQAGASESDAILALARAFDLESFGTAAAKKGVALSDFRDQLLDFLRAQREPITWPFVFTLRKPVEVLGDTFTQLTLREPTAAEFIKFGIFDGDITGEQMLDLIGTLSGIAAAGVRAIPGLDMLSLSAKLSRVFRQAAS